MRTRLPYLCLLFFLIPYLLTCTQALQDWTLADVKQGSTKKVAAPSPISEEMLPISNPYYIRTRLIIEMIHEKTEDQDMYRVYYAASPAILTAVLRNCEQLYEDLGIKFYVVQIVFKRPTDDFREYFGDAIEHKEYLSIYFMLPNNFPMSGLSSVPWQKGVSRGIYMSASADEWTLAHEVGHYFGLLHTFELDDYIDDTPFQDAENVPCERDQCEFPNCMNIMNYCEHYPKEVTPGQIERMRLFLRATRHDNIIFDPPEIPNFEVDIEAVFQF